MRHSTLLLFAVAAFLVLGVAYAKTPYDCDFETDMCGWVPSATYYLFKWQRLPTGDPNRGTGPSTDASGNSAGHSATIQVLREKLAKLTTLGSPAMRSYAKSSTCQMHFSYSLYSAWPAHCTNKVAACKNYDTAAYRPQVCNPLVPSYYQYMEANCALVCGINCAKLKVVASGATTETIFSLKKSMDKKWTHETIAIPEKFTNDDIEIAIEATTGWDLNSYIAVDNIYFTDCNLDPPTTTPTTTTTTPTTPTTTTPTTTPTTLPLSAIGPDMYNCDFEQNDMCRWTSHSQRWKWEVTSQGTPAQGTGPVEDASGIPSGKYAIMKVTSSRITEKASLISPLIDQFKHSPSCRLRFQFSSFGPSFYYCKNQQGDIPCQKHDRAKDVLCNSHPAFAKNQCSKLCGIECTNFRVFVTNDLNRLGDALYHIRSPRDNQWYPADLPIGNHTNGDFQIVFEGTSGLDALSYITIDNIKIEGCQTKIDIPTTTTTTTTTATPSTVTTKPTTTPTTTSSTTPSSTPSATSTQTMTSKLPSTAGLTKNATPALNQNIVISNAITNLPDSAELNIPRVTAAAQSDNKEEKSSSVLGLALGLVGAAVVAVVVIAVATYLVRKKKAGVPRTASVTPLKEAWK